jgi:hypothetical protein
VSLHRRGPRALARSGWYSILKLMNCITPGLIMGIQGRQLL